MSNAVVERRSRVGRLGGWRAPACAALALGWLAAPWAEGQAVNVDFDVQLSIIAQFDGTLAPDADRNNDSIFNGDELALVAAILADPDFPAHDAVRAAYVNNRDLIAADLSAVLTPQVYQAFGLSSEAEAQAVLNAFAAVGGAWMMWDDLGPHDGSAYTAGVNEALRSVYSNNSNDGAYDQIYAVAGGDGVAAFTATFPNFIMAGDIVSQFGDANDDGVENLDHYDAAGGDRAAYIAAALAVQDPDPDPGEPGEPVTTGLPWGGPVGAMVLVLTLTAAGVWRLRLQRA